jgi:hypothetical protein
LKENEQMFSVVGFTQQMSAICGGKSLRIQHTITAFHQRLSSRGAMTPESKSAHCR